MTTILIDVLIVVLAFVAVWCLMGALHYLEQRLVDARLDRHVRSRR